MSDEDLVPVMSIFIVLGGTLTTRGWERDLKELAARVDAISSEYQSPFTLGIVFEVPGETRRPKSVGVRILRFEQEEPVGALRVVIGLPDPPGEGADRELRRLLEDAVTAAEVYARQQGIAQSLPGLRQLLAAL